MKSEPTPKSFRQAMSVVCFAVAAMLVAVATPVVAQTDHGERIEALKKAIDEIEAGSSAGGDVEARIEALRVEIAELEQQIADAAARQQKQAAQPAGTAEDGAAAGTSSQEAPPADQPPPPGVQGSPNPLQRNARYLTGQDLLDDAFPNSIPIPGSEARFRIGGYAKLDFIQDLDNVGDRFEFELATIPVEGTPESALGGRTTMHAKESRINFDFRTVARNENRGWEFPLQAFLEIDFFDDREAFAIQPRLRQAYGVVGRLLAGRTWGITTDVSAMTASIDFSGGDSLYGARVALVRWEDRIGTSWRWAAGVEDPNISIGNPLGLDGAARPSLPNFAGTLRWVSDGGAHVQLGADVFRLEWQGGSAGPSYTQMGYGASISARYLLGNSRNNAISGAATIGSGSAHRVISLSFDGGNDAVITPDGLDAMSHWQVYGGYSHYWTDSLNSSFSAAWAELDNSEFQPDEAIHQAGSVHANLVWFPYKLASTGFEVMWGTRRNKDGSKGNAVRFQYMFRFTFN